VIRRRTLCGGLAAAFLPRLGRATDGWRPSRPIALIVPFAAGSGTDAIARIMAMTMEREIGQQILVDNRAGANGAIAAMATMRAAPDGQTLMMTTNTAHAANVHLMKRLEYDPVKDFTPISQAGRFTFWLVAGGNSPYRNLQDLLAAARARPGQLTYATGNSTGILASASIALQAGVQMTHVPYRSTPPAMTDVIAGRVDSLVVDVSASHSFVQSGQLRPLGIITRDRSRLVPEVLTLHEQGLNGFDLKTWAALVGPAGMAPDVVNALNAAFRRAWGAPETVQRLAAIGFEAGSSTPAEGATFIREEVANWGRMIRAAGIEPE
jgi:tripartite-type tricarboxylate transporter receptor subunit TctC